MFKKTWSDVPQAYVVKHYWNSYLLTWRALISYLILLQVMYLNVAGFYIKDQVLDDFIALTSRFVLSYCSPLAISRPRFLSCFECSFMSFFGAQNWGYKQYHTLVCSWWRYRNLSSRVFFNDLLHQILLEVLRWWSSIEIEVFIKDVIWIAQILQCFSKSLICGVLLRNFIFEICFFSSIL